MDVAALVISVLAFLAAGASALYARRQANVTSKERTRLTEVSVPAVWVAPGPKRSGAVRVGNNGAHDAYDVVLKCEAAINRSKFSVFVADVLVAKDPGVTIELPSSVVSEDPEMRSAIRGEVHYRTKAGNPRVETFTPQAIWLRAPQRRAS